jgi:hypothetical protein
MQLMAMDMPLHVGAAEKMTAGLGWHIDRLQHAAAT